MADVRKLVATALTGSDLSDDVLRETALDRIWGLAFSDELGRRLWRLKYANDRSSWEPALHLLVRRLRSNRQAESRTLVVRLCTVVLKEWLQEQCRACGGRAFLIHEAVKRVCTTCEGTGLARHSDIARQRAMGLERAQLAKWDSRFARAHMLIAEADYRTAREVLAQLERLAGRTVLGVLPDLEDGGTLAEQALHLSGTGAGDARESDAAAVANDESRERQSS